jgi:transposase
MIRIQLPDTEAERLEQVLRTATEAKLRHRVQIVLMAHRGRRHGDIAADTGTTPRSVQRWLNAYLDGGLERLRPRKAKGATPKLTADLAPTLKRWIIDGPAKQGLDRANWTYEELAEHLFHAEGIRVRKSALPVFCRRHEIRPYRPTYRSLRGDPDKQAEARVELAALKEGRRPASRSR